LIQIAARSHDQCRHELFRCDSRICAERDRAPD
jgi:hypothetical protein